MAFYGPTKHALLIAMEWMRIDPKLADIDPHVLMSGAVYTPPISGGLPDPAAVPAELGLIMPDQCADTALRGMDHGLFYPPTHGHFIDDMQPSLLEIQETVAILDID